VHVVATDADGVEPRHVAGGVGKNIADDAHAGPRRVDVGIAHHELFEDIILYGAAEFVGAYALFLSRHNIEGHDRDDSTVHGHGYRHLIQRYLVEEDFHVLNGINGNARLADISLDPLVITVIPTVCGKIKGNRKSLLALGQVAAVKSVALFCRAEACILAYGPGAYSIHRGVGPSQIGRLAGGIVERVVGGNFLSRKPGRYFDAFGRCVYRRMIGAGTKGVQRPTEFMAAKVRACHSFVF